MKLITAADDILFRSSGLGHIMPTGDPITEKQAATIIELSNKAKITEKQQEELDRLINKRDNPVLTDAVKKHLIDVFVSARYGRREEINSKYLDKGTHREEDAITLLSRINKTFFRKNDVRLRNEFIQGEPDLFLGEAISKADETFDTKVSYTAHTFFRAKFNPLDIMYYWQGMGYMWLTGAMKHTVVYCLVNSTVKNIETEKRFASYLSEEDDFRTDPKYIERCKTIERNHIFDIQEFTNEYPGYQLHTPLSQWKYDIPYTERLHTKTIERDEAVISSIKDRIIECRKHMNQNLFKV